MSLREWFVHVYLKDNCKHANEAYSPDECPLCKIERLQAALEHIASHHGSAEQCREIAQEALRAGFSQWRETTKDSEEMVLVSVCDVCDQLYPKHLEGCEDGSHDMEERPKSWVERRRGLPEKDTKS